MVALGLVLFVLAVLATLGITFFNTEPTDVQAFGVTLSDVSVGGLFLAGVVIGALGAVGLSLLLAGLARRRSRSVRTKRAVTSARTEAEMLAEENARLHEQLDSGREEPYPSDPTARRGRGRHGAEQ